MSRKRILVWTGDDLQPGLSDAVEKPKGVSALRSVSRAEAMETMTPADASIASNALWSEDCWAVLAGSSNPVWIQLISAEFDNLARAGMPAHVVVSINGGAGAHVVAERTVALLMALLRQRLAMIHAQVNHLSSFDSLVPGMQALPDRRIAVVGYRNIGSSIVDLLTWFGLTGCSDPRRALYG